MATNESVQRILRAFALGESMRRSREQSQTEELERQQIQQGIQQRGELFPLQQQSALAELLGQTEEGGTIPQGTILGQRGRRTQQLELEGQLAQRKRAGELAAETEAFAKLSDQAIEQAKKKVDALGLPEDDPRRAKLMASALGLPEQVRLGSLSKSLGVEIPEELADTYVESDKALQAITRVRQSQISGQTRVTVAGMRGGGGKGLSPAQETALAEMLTLDRDAQEIERLYGAAKGMLGPIQGRGRELARGQGIEVNKDFNQLAVSVARFKNKLLKIRSGAAVTDNEMRRIAQELPNVTDSPQDFEIKLQQALGDIRAAIEIFEQTAGTGSGQTTVVVPRNVGRDIDDF